MENKLLNILAIGRNADIMQVMQRLVNVPGKRTGLAVTNDEDAIAAVGQQSFDLALLCAGINEDEEAILKEKLQQLNPGIVIIRHYGGGSGLLDNEILAAMDRVST